MSDIEQADQVEIKPSFSFRYISLATFVALLPTVIGGGIGWVASEYWRDHKVIEVTTAASANLTPIANSVAGNLEIHYRVNDTEKQAIGGLFKYDITLANTSSEGAADLSIIVIAPKDIELTTAEPLLETEPPVAVNAIKLQTSDTEKTKRVFSLNLLNTKQKVSLSLYGFSRDVNQTSAPLQVVIQKKDWVQRNVDQSSPSSERLLREFLFTRAGDMTVIYLLCLILILPALYGFGRAYFRISVNVALAIVTTVFRSSPRDKRRLLKLFD